MTTIQASTQQIQTSGASGTSSSNDIATQITRILDKIQKLTQQLNELANSPGSTEDKKKQQELIQTQIKVLQAQLAALMAALDTADRDAIATLSGPVQDAVDAVTDVGLQVEMLRALGTSAWMLGDATRAREQLTRAATTAMAITSGSLPVIPGTPIGQVMRSMASRAMPCCSKRWRKRARLVMLPIRPK